MFIKGQILQKLFFFFLTFVLIWKLRTRNSTIRPYSQDRGKILTGKTKQQSVREGLRLRLQSKLDIENSTAKLDTDTMKLTGNCILSILLCLMLMGQVREASGQLCKQVGRLCVENSDAKMSCSKLNRLCGWVGSSCRCRSKQVIGKPDLDKNVTKQ